MSSTKPATSKPKSPAPYDSLDPVPTAIGIQLLVDKEKMASANANVSRGNEFESLTKKKKATVEEDFENAWLEVMSIIEGKKDPIELPSISEQMRAIRCFGETTFTGGFIFDDPAAKPFEEIPKEVLESKADFMEDLLKVMDEKDCCLQQSLEGFCRYIKALIQKALVHKLRVQDEHAAAGNVPSEDDVSDNSANGEPDEDDNEAEEESKTDNRKKPETKQRSEERSSRPRDLGRTPKPRVNLSKAYNEAADATSESSESDYSPPEGAPETLKNTRFRSNGIFDSSPLTRKILQLIIYMEKRGSNLNYEEDEEIMERTIKDVFHLDKLACSTASVLPGMYVDLMMHGEFRKRINHKHHALKNEPEAGIRLLVFLVYVVFCPWDQTFYERTLAPMIYDWSQSAEMYADFQILYGMFAIGGCGKPGALEKFKNGKLIRYNLRALSTENRKRQWKSPRCKSFHVVCTLQLAHIVMSSLKHVVNRSKLTETLRGPYGVPVEYHYGDYDGNPPCSRSQGQHLFKSFQYDMWFQCFMYFSNIGLDAFIPPKPGARKKKKKEETITAQQWRDRIEMKVSLLRNCVAVVAKDTPGVAKMLQQFDAIKTSNSKKENDPSNEENDAGVSELPSDQADPKQSLIEDHFGLDKQKNTKGEKSRNVPVRDLTSADDVDDASRAKDVASGKTDPNTRVAIGSRNDSVEEAEAVEEHAGNVGRGKTDPNTRVTEEAEDVTEAAKDVTEEAEDVTEEAEDVIEEAEDVTEEAEDVTEEAEDVTEEAEDVTEEVEDATEDAGNATTNSKDVSTGEQNVSKKAENVSKEVKNVAKGAEDVGIGEQNVSEEESPKQDAMKPTDDIDSNELDEDERSFEEAEAAKKKRKAEKRKRKLERKARKQAKKRKRESREEGEKSSKSRKID